MHFCEVYSVFRPVTVFGFLTRNSVSRDSVCGNMANMYTITKFARCEDIILSGS